MFLAKISLAMARVGFGMGLYDDPRAGVFGLRIKQHFAKGVAVGAAGQNRSVLAALVDNKNIAGVGHRQCGIKGVVFGDMPGFQGGNPRLGAVQKRRVIKRVFCQDHLKVGSGLGIIMHSAAINIEPDGRITVTPQCHRAQKTVLDADDWRAAPCRDRLAAWRGGAVPPNADQITFARCSQLDIVSCQFHDATHPTFGQETAVIDVKVLASVHGHSSQAIAEDGHGQRAMTRPPAMVWKAAHHRGRGRPASCR